VNKEKMDIKVGYVYIEDIKMSKYWLVCNLCGYTKEVYNKEEINDNEKCPLCEGIMIWDMNAGKKLEAPLNEPLGDNFPKFPIEHYSKQDLEIINNVRIIGEFATWDTIEKIADAKLRIQYRNIFLKLGYNFRRNNEKIF
jgi:uncharacterized metal-binding protein